MTSAGNRICFINLDYRHLTTRFSFCFLSLNNGWTLPTVNDHTIASQCLLSQSLSFLSSDYCDFVLRLDIAFIQNFLIASLLDQTNLSSFQNQPPPLRELLQPFCEKRRIISFVFCPFSELGQQLMELWAKSKTSNGKQTFWSTEIQSPTESPAWTGTLMANAKKKIHWELLNTVGTASRSGNFLSFLRGRSRDPCLV